MGALFRVVAPGAFTTVQDEGRFGYQAMGVPVSGALDKRSYRLANLLVGNSVGEAALEVTIVGPKLEVLAEADLTVTGALVPVKLNGEEVGCWRSIRVKPGDLLEIGQVRAGCRAYLAVGGGFELPPVMGSRSTYMLAGLGGLEGRNLRAGDMLCASCVLLGKGRELPEKFIPVHEGLATLRAVAGPQSDYFSNSRALEAGEYMVTAKADRMGYRVQGRALEFAAGYPGSIVSEPSVPGGIQVPPDGQPIILLVEQTVGGYAKPATVISQDISRLAQTTPGDSVCFELVSLERAHLIAAQERRELEELRELLRA